MQSKTILIKFPDNKYHTAEVSRYVDVTIDNRVISTIWYVDLNELDLNEKKPVGSFSIIRKNENGSFTNLDCGDIDQYTKIYEDIKKSIANNQYKELDVDILTNIDNVEQYSYEQKNNNKQPSLEAELPILASEKDLKEITDILSEKIGSHVDPYFQHSYQAMEADIKSKLNTMKENTSKDKWFSAKNAIIKYLSLKELDMQNGYITIDSVEKHLKEIEELAHTIINADKKEAINEVYYTKTIYVLWNELLSRFFDIIYLEYASYTNFDKKYMLEYANISNNYSQIKEQLLGIIEEKELSINRRNTITVTDNNVKYNFIIIPVEDFDLFISIKESKAISILTEELFEPYQILVDSIKRKNTIVTDSETISTNE